MPAPKLKAFRIMSGAHVGPDFTKEPSPISSPTQDDPDRAYLSFPPRQFKATAFGNSPESNQSNVVYSPADLSKKFNHPNSTRFTALGDAPEAVQARFEEAFESGNLDPRQSGVGGGLPRRLSVVDGSRSPRVKEVGPTEDTSSGEDPRDLSPGGSEDLHALTISDLRELAADEEIEVPSRATKNELVEAIKQGRKER